MRGWIATLGGVAALVALTFAAMGWYRSPFDPPPLGVGVLIVLSVSLLWRGLDRLRRPLCTRRWGDLELGTMSVAVGIVLLEAAGGPETPAYPLILLLIAFLSSYQRWLHTAYFLGLILTAEAAILWASEAFPAAWSLFLIHAVCAAAFAGFYQIVFRGELARRQRWVRGKIRDELDRIAEEAREFRLTSGLGLESRELADDEIHKRRRVGSVLAIRDSLYNVLAVAEKALRPHTVALLWLDERETYFRIRELRTSSEVVTELPIRAGEGFVGAVAKKRQPLVLTQVKTNQGGLSYYSGRESVTDFAALPIVEGKSLRGILLADRITGEAFDADDIAVMSAIADEVLRTVQLERIFSDMDREKNRKERFYLASRDFNSALTVEEVAQVAIEAACRVARITQGVLAVATEREGILRITATLNAEQWRGREFEAEGTLVGQAIRAQIPLPHSHHRSRSEAVFGAEIPAEFTAVKVLPLLWKKQAVGALVLAADREDFLSDDVLDMMRVIADHAAIAIANAQMYARMERMATTDGLTGLTNHRQFQIAADEVLARSKRYDRGFALILTDIDHFKTVNDTYGHPAGDVVLRRVAEILEECARRTDIVARYGGEEFAILMEETDQSGALKIAERIRTAAEAQSFRTEHGSFRCTMSLGISTYPEDGQNKAEIIERADQNLYEAKHGGRNRVVLSPKTKRIAAS